MKRLLHLVGDAALFEIFAGGFRLGVLCLQLRFPKIECDLVQLDDLIGKLLFLLAFLLASFVADVVNRLGQHHARNFGDAFDRLGEVQPLHFHHEIERRPALAAAETFVKPFCRIDRERRRLFLMKRTARHPIRPFLLQILSIRLYYPHQIGTGFQVIDEVLGVEHLPFVLRYQPHFPVTQFCIGASFYSLVEYPETISRHLQVVEFE